jgi:hypothetical protein
MDKSQRTRAYANAITQLALIRAKEEEYYFLAENTNDEKRKEKYLDNAMALGDQWINLSAQINILLSEMVKDIINH